uniref:Uncharacterized protein n=1 Tax=Lepeophtheirus salmonis TaxID=72036 RepID=A0A0K2SWK9_LEPSM
MIIHVCMNVIPRTDINHKIFISFFFTNYNNN